MGQFQNAVRQEYEERGYSHSIELLALGLCEEAGEIASAVLDMSDEFKPSVHREKSDLVHELHDCLTYLCAIANSAGIDLGI